MKHTCSCGHTHTHGLGDSNDLKINLFGAMTMYMSVHTLIHILALFPFLDLIFHGYHGHHHGGEMILESIYLNILLHVELALLVVISENYKMGIGWNLKKIKG